MDDSEWEQRLADRFPKRDPQSAIVEWEAVKSRLHFGEFVAGSVVAKAPFGAWIDLGLGFPALLEIGFIDGLTTPATYESDNCCAIDSLVTVRVGRLMDDKHQIGLWQVDPNGFLSNEREFEST